MKDLVDCHAHLCDPAFDADRAEVLARARDLGVTAVVAVGETLDDARRNLELSASHSELRPAAAARGVAWRSVGRGVSFAAGASGSGVDAGAPSPAVTPAGVSGAAG